MRKNAFNIFRTVCWTLVFAGLSVKCFQYTPSQPLSPSFHIATQIGGWFFALLAFIGIISFFVTLFSKK